MLLRLRRDVMESEFVSRRCKLDACVKCPKPAIPYGLLAALGGLRDESIDFQRRVGRIGELLAGTATH